ncbi:MAG: hypothetical protein DRN81_02595 [Thermoproteota archaeon]|nr:MAG: hypothetical protein DRN81_02595 [Candidatus Korarchaeota archaeon]
MVSIGRGIIDYLHPESPTVKLYYKNNLKEYKKMLVGMIARASDKTAHKLFLKQAVDKYIVPAAKHNIEVQMRRHPESAKWGRTGTLAESVHSEYLGGRSIFGINVPADRAVVLVGTPYAYGRFIEFGIPPRRAVRAKVMVFKDIYGNIYFRKFVKGSAPRPWLIPAVYSNIKRITKEAGFRVTTYIIHGNKSDITSTILSSAYTGFKIPDVNAEITSVEIEI